MLRTLLMGAAAGRYREAAQAFLDSPAYRDRFSLEAFAREIVDALVSQP